jgi:molecular chaperone GrpE
LAPDGPLEVLIDRREERTQTMTTGPNNPADDRAPDAGKAPLEIGAPAAGPERPQSESDAPDAAYRERDEYRDLLLRKTAEFDNYRKRIERERREQAAAEVIELIEALLPVVDDFERALGVDAVENEEAYRAGVELIHRQLRDLLARRGVTAIEAVGADFDPRIHQAVVTEASPGRRDGEVIAELRRGYKLGDRLLRPAMVKVAKA